MKKLKRLVAVLLVGIMALAMLTACGVTPSAPSMRDTALERDVAQWTVEWGKNQNPTLTVATVYKGNIIKNLIMDCQSYTKYRPNETTGGIFVSWRRKEELPTGA